jgi:hypothetical protein
MFRKTKECAVPLTRMLDLLMTVYSVDLCSGCHPTSSWRTKLGLPWGEERKRHLQEMQNGQRVFDLTYETMGTKMQEPLSCQFIRGIISTFASYIVRAVWAIVVLPLDGAYPSYVAFEIYSLGQCFGRSMS